MVANVGCTSRKFTRVPSASGKVAPYADGTLDDDDGSRNIR